MGEPILTAQPFYFLERLESVVKVRFESNQIVPAERTIEYIIDNYLFEYSKNHPEDKITNKSLNSCFGRTTQITITLNMIGK